VYAAKENAKNNPESTIETYLAIPNTFPLVKLRLALFAC